MMKFILLIFASLSFMAGYFYEASRTLQLATELSEVRQENQKLKERIESLQKQSPPPVSSNIATAPAPSSVDLATKIAMKQKELNDLRDQLNDAQVEHARNSSLDVDPRTIQRQKESLQSAQDELNNLENQKKSNLSGAKTRNAELKKKTLDYDKSQIDALNQAITNQNSLISATRAEMEALKKRRPVDKAMVEQLTINLEQQKSDLAQTKSNRGLWASSQQQAKSITHDAGAFNDDLDGQIKAARANVAVLKKQIVDATLALQDSDNYDQKIAALQHAIQTKQKELDQLQ